MNSKLVYCLLFLTSFAVNFLYLQENPIISADMTAALSDGKDNVISHKLEERDVFQNVYETPYGSLQYSLVPPVQSFVFKNGYRVPMRFSARHTGMAIAMYKAVTSIVPRDIAHSLWHSFLRGIQVVLLFSILQLMGSTVKLSCLTCVLYLLDPLSLTSYYVFISEGLLHTNVLLVILLLLKKKPQFKMAMLIVGLSLCIRPNFLWMIAAFVPLFWSKYKGQVGEGLFYILLGFLPFFIFFNSTEFIAEVMLVKQSWSPVSLIKYLLSSIFLPKIYLETYLSENIRVTNFDYIITALIFIFTSYGFYKNRRDLESKKILLGLVLSLIIIWPATRAGENYVLYMFYLTPVFYLLVFKAFKNLGKMFICSLSLLLLIKSLSFAIVHLKEGNRVIFDYSLHQKVVDKIIKNGWEKNIVTVGGTDLGKFSYLSDSKIETTNLFQLFNEYKAKSIAELLMIYQKSGVLVISTSSHWSEWNKVHGDFKIDQFERNSKKYGVQVIEIMKVTSGEDRKFYLINYKID